ncbi:MAG: LysR substrate-binding domain-containing protein [Paracoccaceae bacterium]|nr:LysR substrate-binding domain-containing protein [Paracoccaceae bacterium]MDH5530221.1 LysR substrate-binding domain-containing protein [Paracoccaceae bacterium]
MPLTLPPLNSLRAFEAAARNGSYVAAAEELSVSPAAISQHVKKLEEFLGKQLFMRSNNRVILTDAGAAVYSGAADALQAISEFTDQVMSDRSRSRLVISTISSVAERWLETKLARFALINPNLRFDLRVESDPVDFARNNIDLRICYGAGHYPGMTVVKLIHDEVLPLCSPAYLDRVPAARMSGMGAVPDQDLIHTSWGPAFVSHPTWASWYAQAGLPAPNETKGYQIGTSGLVLDMARDGIGVALGQRMMAEDDMASGKLVALSDTGIALGHPYCLVYPNSKTRRPGLLGLTDWLTNSVTSTPPE